MIMKPLIVVYGVSGAGKTTSCDDFVSKHTDFICITASNFTRNKIPENDFIKNQIDIANSINQIRHLNSNKSVLLDAHSFIFYKGNTLEIPASIVAMVNPSGLILINEIEQVVRMRRKINNDQICRNVSLSVEIDLCEKIVMTYARTLNLPLLKIESSDDLERCVIQLLEKIS